MTTAAAPVRKFVYQWLDFGFFSELNHMLLAILYCRLHNREFVLSSRYATVFHEKGWQDFFLPFGAETDNRVLHLLDSRPLGWPTGLKPKLLEARRFINRSLLRWLVQPLFYRDVEVLCQNFEAIRSLIPPPEDGRGAPQQGRSMPNAESPPAASLRESLRAINRDVWRFNRQTTDAVASSIARLGLPDRYGALHIRRGDMSRYVPPVDEARYIERLERESSLRDVYVATDDYRCAQRIERLRPDWRVRSLCPTTCVGYFPEEFDRQPADERGRRTLLLLTETEILRRAEMFVGTFSSGVGTYQGIAREHHTYGVDAGEWIFEGGL